MTPAMNMLHKWAALPVVAAIFLTGCTTSGKFPSLARRAQEDVPGRITGSLALPDTATPPSGTDGAFETQNATQDNRANAADAMRLGEQAEAAHGRFASKRARADQLTGAARKAEPGSEAWSAAAVALAELTAERDATLAALAEIDSIYGRERIDGGDGGAIAAVRDQVTAMVADDDAVLANLEGRVRF